MDPFDPQIGQVRGFANLSFLGVTTSGGEYNAVGEACASPAWRRPHNGNPPNMVDVVRALFPDQTILFLVERDINRNAVVYTLDKTRSKVVVYWLMIPSSAPFYTHDFPNSQEVDLGQIHTEDLTAIENRLAYGVVMHQTGSDQLCMSVKAIGEERIFIDTYTGVASIIIADNSMELRRVFISTEARSWMPYPKTVEVHVECATAAQEESVTVTYHYAV